MSKIQYIYSFGRENIFKELQKIWLKNMISDRECLNASIEAKIEASFTLLKHRPVSLFLIICITVLPFVIFSNIGLKPDNTANYCTYKNFINIRKINTKSYFNWNLVSSYSGEDYYPDGAKCFGFVENIGRVNYYSNYGLKECKINKKGFLTDCKDAS